MSGQGTSNRTHQNHLREFHLLSSVLLSKSERQILYKILKDYQRRHSVERLIQGLRLVLRSPQKLELLKYIRSFLSRQHVADFDRLTNFRTLFRVRRPQRKRRTTENAAPSIASTSTGGQTSKAVKVITVNRDPGEPSLGFSVRGGSEHGLGIYVSEIDKGSVADLSGLQLGDKILEANNISLKGVSSSSAVKVLTGSNRLKLVLQRTRKVPEWRLSREKTAWYDVHDKKLITGEFEECGMTHYIRGLDVDVPERRVNLKFSRTDKTLGFNVRGGTEYGLGIYVSSLDPGGLAEQNGVRIGDQIIDVNGIPFDNITHTHAVEVLKDKRHLILTLRDVGRFPAYKELYAEYTWSAGHVRSAASEQGLANRDITIEYGGSLPPMRTRSSSDLFNKNKRPSGVPLQSDIFLPYSKGQGRSGHLERQKELDELSATGSDGSFNLEEWAEQMTESGNLNPGYVSDSELDVVVHAENFIIQDGTEDHHRDRNKQDEQDTEIRCENARMQNTSSLHVSDEYDATDAMYAKIERRSDRSNDVSRLSVVGNPDSDSDSDSGNEGQYQISPRKGSAASVSFLLRSESEGFSVSNREPGNDEDSSCVLVSENRQDFIAGEELETAHSVGGLYSQVRKLSVASLSQRPSTPTPSPSPQQQMSRSQKEESGDEETWSVIQSGNAVEINIINSTPVKRPYDTDDYGSASHLAVSGFHGNPYDINESEGQSSSLEDSSSTQGFGDKNDENFTVYNLEERIKDLEERKMTIGLQELNTLSQSMEDDKNDRKKSISGESSVGYKSSKWKSFKNKIKGSLRLKSPKSESLKIEDMEIPPGSVRKKKGVFERTFGGKVLHQNTVDGYSLAVLEDSARKMLPDEEFEAVMRHIKTYHDNHDLERLVQVLLAILDKPEKLLLLRDVRGVIYPLDTVQFDGMVNKYEIQAYETLSMKLHLPLIHNKQRKPRKTLMTTQIASGAKSNQDPHVTIETSAGDNGHFHIRAMDQYNRERDTQEAVVEVMRETVSERKSSESPRHMNPSVSSPTRSSHFGSPNHGRGLPGSEVSGGQGRSQRSEVVMSITDQFGYLDQESSDAGSGVAVLSDFDSVDKSEEKMTGAFVVHLSKNKPVLGLTVSEGQDPKLHNVVKVSSIEPGSAASDDSTIQVGMVLVSVDGHSLLNSTQSEATVALTKSFEEKQHVSMKLVLLPESVDTYM